MDVDTRAVGEAAGTVIAGRYRVGALRHADRRRRVHYGWDALLHRAVAVLLVPRCASGPDDGSSATLPTLPLTQAHQHRPGLVELYDGGMHRGEVFLVCQLVPGPTLATLLEERLDPGELAALGCRLARALEPVHRRGAAHAALTPDRILLGRSRPMIAECGLSSVLERCSGLAGDAAYRAPEQDTGPAVPASDVYALGRILGRARLRSPLSRDARALRALARRMTASDPTARPTTDEVAADLAADRGARPPAVSPRDVSGRLVRAAGLAVAAAAVVVGATTALTLDRTPAGGASATLAPGAPSVSAGRPAVGDAGASTPPPTVLARDEVSPVASAAPRSGRAGDTAEATTSAPGASTSVGGTSTTPAPTTTTPSHDDPLHVLRPDLPDPTAPDPTAPDVASRDAG